MFPVIGLELLDRSRITPLDLKQYNIPGCANISPDGDVGAGRLGRRHVRAAHHVGSAWRRAPGHGPSPRVQAPPVATSG